jgi:hypothetical protein
MSKTESIANHSRENPFLTDKASSLWERLNKGGKKITKEELLKRSKKLKEKS